MTDDICYHRFLDGDDQGLTELMERYGNSLTFYIDGYLRDIHEAEDLMIEVFAYLIAKKPCIRVGCLKAYLYKAARNMALRHKSRLRRCFSLEDWMQELKNENLVETVIRTEEQKRILHYCMGQLNQDYREALYLIYFEAMSYAQAAEVMGKNEKQITNIVYRAKQNLRGLLEQEGITSARY